MSLHGDPGEPCCDLAPGRKVPAASLSPSVSPYLNTTLRRVSLPSTGRSRSSPGLLWGTEGSRVVGAPRLGGSARGHPGGWGRGTLGHGVLAPSSHFLCALKHGRGQSSLSPPCRRRRTVLSPPPSLFGVPHHPSRCLYQSAVTAQVLLLQNRMASVSSISPRTYGLSCPRGSVLGRGSGWGSPPRSPSGSMRPPARCARGTRSARSVPAAATPSRPRLPTQPVPPLRLNIDRCQPCGRAAVSPRGRAGEGGEPGRGHKGRVAGGPRALGSSRTPPCPDGGAGQTCTSS